MDTWESTVPKWHTLPRPHRLGQYRHPVKGCPDCDRAVEIGRLLIIELAARMK